MAGPLVPSIQIYFGLGYGSGNYFTLDDPVKGVLDNTDYLIADPAGDPVEVGGDAVSFSIQRGRSRELDEIQTGTATVVLENWNRVYDALNAAGLYFGELTPGKRITIAMHGVTLFDGSIEDIHVDWPVGAAPTATFTAEDALGTLARKEFDAWTATAAQTAGPRLAAILDRPEVAFSAMRDLDPGISTLQGDSVTWGSNVLNYAQLVAKSDLGRLFASRDGQLVFRDRHSLIGATTEVVFRDDTTPVEFVEIQTQTGSRYVVNRVGVDREGGTLQTVEGDTTLGVRPLNRTGLLMDSDVQSHDMAEYLLNIYGNPVTRISSIMVDVAALADADAASVASLDISSKAEVVWTPGGVGAQVDQLVAVEGVNHDWVSFGRHMMQISTSPVFQQAVFILDDPVRGVLDNTDYLLAF